MASTSAIHNPLGMNLHRQTRILQNVLPAHSIHAKDALNASSTSELLAALSNLLSLPAFTLTIATLYRPILFDLCARWLEGQENTEEQLVALCLLLEVHEELFPILYRLIHKTPFVEGPLGFITSIPLPLSIDVSRLQRLLLAYYRILHANRELPRILFWPLAPLSILIWTPHLDNGVRLLAIRCYAFQSGMGEAEREKIEREVLGEPCGVDCQLEFGQNVDGSRKEVDGWVMPVIEMQRIKDMREEIVRKSQNYYLFEDGEPAFSIDPSELSPFTANIHGVFLLRAPGPPTDSPIPLIPTQTTVQALQSLAFHLSLRLPTLITSPPSSGKSLFLTYLAEKLYPGATNQIITIHLADTSLDPRALLGSYVSSPTQPGTFEWKEGVLVRSMREGKWVIFKDIDRGSNEVLGVIKPLVESLHLGKWIGGRAYLEVPSRGRVIAHDNFALFATRSTPSSRTGSFPPPVFFGAHKFHEVAVPSPTLDELRMILDARFPRLAGSAALALIRLWEAVKALEPAASTRDIGLRELEKFSVRTQRLLPDSHHSMDVDSHGSVGSSSLSAIFPNPTLREDMYLEARDVFFGAGTLTTSARNYFEAVALVIGEHLGLEADRRDWVLHGRTPDFDLEKDANNNILVVRIGQSRLVAKTPKLEMVPPVMRPFAMHKPAILLLSRIAAAVSLSEPVLLTGETGTGKTSIVTHLASLLRRPLISLNLSHQTESSDLLGGFKPVDARIPGSALQQRFLDLFGGTFSRRKNEKFETEVRNAVRDGKWKRAVGLWKESGRLARERIQAKQGGKSEGGEVTRDLEAETPKKRRKLDSAGLNVSEANWASFIQDVEEFEVQHVHGKGKFAFGFVEGPLVKALRSGDWVLLDEINLASPETLECISSLLHSPTASITLTEQGSLEPVPRHPEFRLFACMNPATDVGKKDLPPNVRSRFTEIDVPPPDADKETLLSIINQYIGASAVGDKAAIMNVADFYSAVKDLSEKRQIADGSNHRPHYSMRTLARALTFASDVTSMFGLRRAIWEGCLMAFTMVLDSSTAGLVTALAEKHLLAGVRNPRSMLIKEPPVPRSRSADEFIKFGPFYLEKGPLPVDPVEDYIMTPSVETKLIDLARIILTRRFPVLIEGPTSSGKTSSVEYLAKRTGHRFIRINNHEHTDIQEYIGSYVSDPITGKLVFKDGLLVRALRNGDWIVLDELNLAPTDVLEALNRLLDDNRELVIPETHEVVHPHPHFMLFATQNPPGLYAGRKVLSRAFRNRFLEVHFEDVPQVELETILCQRCRIAPSYGKRIVTVFHELQKRRQSGRVFESKQGFATLRDLFRWAGRDAIGYQELADNGYMLLAERARREDDKMAVKEVIESVMNVKIDEKAMYNLHGPSTDFASFLGCPLPTSSDIIWTSAMQRLFILVSRALKFNEPVLLVGETGSGKTSVCQIFAESCSQHLHSLNCHQNTETADLIGGLRPVRNRSTREAESFQEISELLNGIGISDIPSNFNALSSALNDAIKSDANIINRPRLQDAQNRLLRLQSIFEWRDGPLVEAMRNGDVFLLDEISLADDSVLERLNSVLEPSRTIVLAERGGDDLEHTAIQANETFKLIATMNPGGDYGKKELSPALRNRFTEIWVPRVDNRSDLELIVGSLWNHNALKPYTTCVLDFVEWLCTRVGDQSLLSLRDILAWVTFTNSAHQPEHTDCIPPPEIFHHAAHMTFLDGLGSLPQLSGYSRGALQILKDEALAKLVEIVPLPDCNALFSYVPVHNPKTSVQFGSFAILKGPAHINSHNFNLHAPTTRDNAMRVIRACQVLKPILLEGSPGVGKTSLIAALANISGHKLCRINLSDQTDLMDLFGSDLPVEGGGPGEFSWKDAEFLKALQEGHWVLLDEMNLAPQAVLEGLNAVLDHRGTVYIPELGRSFARHPSFRIFAAQNPLNQGGGRKGLPKSFVNRFTKVYIEELSSSDLFIVCQHIFPDFSEDMLRAMISFNTYLNEEVGIQRRFGREGSPWEFNLRDIVRWGTLLRARTLTLSRRPIEHLQTIYLHRFRTSQDRNLARLLFEKVFSISAGMLDYAPNISISPSNVQIGHFVAQRKNMVSFSPPGRILKMNLSNLESLGHCISQSWLAILTGQKNSGKTNAVRVLAHFTGNFLQEISISSSTDTMDILGSFEQVDIHSQALAVVDEIISRIDEYLRTTSGSRLCQNKAHALRRVRHQPVSVNLLLRTALEVVSESHEIPDLGPLLLNRINALLSTVDSTGRFEWVDGPLVQAMRHGHWLLMDGANICNPSVLDRLNSLCEPDGFLTLNERGYVNGELQILRPHPNFRLFMTVDPQYGELSRAMRNRGIEIALTATPVADDQNILSDYYRLPYLASVAGDSKPQCVAFDASRRGMSDLFVQSTPLICSSGRIMDQDSALSTLVDQAPMIIIPDLKTTELTDAHIFFLARTLPPSHIVHFNRLIESLPITFISSFNRIQSLFNSFPDGPLKKALFRFQESYSTLWELPLSHIFTQPMDLYLTTPPHPDRMLQINVPSAHHVILQMLDLAVALLLDQEDQNRTNIKSHSSESGYNKASEEIALILDSIHSMSSVIVDSVVADEQELKLEEVKLAFKLLGYGKYLRKASEGASFDFSAVQAILKWILDAVEYCPPQFHSIAAQARALSRTISLSSGLGIIEIWSTFFVENSLTPSADLENLEKLASNLQCADMQSLRRQVFDLMSLRTLPGALSGAADITLSGLKSDLEHHLHKQHSNEILPDLDINIPPIFLIAELNTFAASDVAAWTKSMTEIIDLACDARINLIRMVPYQHLVWATHAEKSTVPVKVQTQTQWLNALWNISSSKEDLNGPTMLLQPTQLNTILLSCNWTHKTLDSVQDYEAEVRRNSRIVSLQSNQDISRMDQLTRFLYQSISLVVACFASSFDTDTSNFLLRLASNPTARMAVTTNEILTCMDRSNYEPFRNSVQKILRPPFQCVQDTEIREPSIVDLGLCWIAVGNLIIDLFVPNAPVDPVAIQNCTTDRWRQEENMMMLQSKLHRQLEQLMTGNSSNDLLDFLKKDLDNISKELSNVPSLPVRKDVARLHMFWSEVSQFQKQVLSPLKVEELVTLLRAGGENALLREQVIQKSMAGFCQRLDTVYPDYADLNSPIQMAVLHIRMGLRLIAHSGISTSRPTANDTCRAASALVAFPSVRSFAALRADSMTSGPLGIGAFRHLLLSLSAIAMERALGVSMETQMDMLDLAYEQALRLWLIDRAKKGEEEEASQSLYRRKNLDHDAIGEAEMEEQEFLALFPAYEDALDSEPMHTQKKTQPTSLFQPAEMHLLVTIHNSLFGTLDSQINIGFNDFRKSTLQSLLDSHLSFLPDTLDNESIAFQFSLLHEMLTKLKSASISDTNLYDFYHDANVAEVKKAIIILNGLKTRLKAIIQEWPDQMVLHHLHNRCEIILGLDLHSPVAKVLSALEQLLLQTEDWEMYSNRENTLKLHQQALVGLIVEWRRLELSCWQVLLESQAKIFNEGVSEWWFRLYDAAIRGPWDAWARNEKEGPQNLTQYLDTFIPLLDEFILSSPLGQFQTRMDLLRSFDTYLHHLSWNKPPNRQLVLLRVRQVLHATVRYYSLYSDQLLGHLGEQKALLEKEIRGFIKLASWRDINVQALKQSAQRTHHQLYKIVRKFRDLLRQPISEWLRPQLADNTEAKPLQFDIGPTDYAVAQPVLPNIESGSLSSIHLLHLNKTFSKFKSLVTERIRPFIYSGSARPVDSLAVDIIVTAKELSALSVPTNVSVNKRSQQQKAVMVRKRKAWSDLLKELKRVGFAANVKPEVLQQHADPRWLREQPIMPEIADHALSTQKGENYFSRLYGSLPELRSSISNHHSDLTTRELQRGIMMLESGFSMSLDLRRRLAEVTTKYLKVEQIFTRLKMLISTSNITPVPPNLLYHASSIEDVLSRTLNAIQEVQHGIKKFNDLQSMYTIPESFIEEIRVFCDLTATLQKRLVVVLNDIKLTSTPVLLESENKLLIEISRHLSLASITLTRWSQEQPRLQYLFRPVVQWLTTQVVTPLLSPDSQTTPPLDSMDFLINCLLLTVQNLLSNCPEVVEDVQADDEDQYILRGYHVIRNFTHLLNIDAVIEALNGVLLRFTSTKDDLQQHLQRVLPFLSVYIGLVKDQLVSHNQWTKALLKLNFILCSVIHTLSTQGFCKPPDADETEAKGGASETAEGVGLGDGSGLENASKDIEDESQVEGLQGDDAEDQAPKDKNDDTGTIEMSEDFAGGMEDVPDTGSQDDADSDHESDNDPEDKLGNLDASDPSAIDEKLWGDEKGPQNDQPDDKTNQDHAEKQSGNSDIVAKEGKEQSRQKERMPDEKEIGEDATSDTEDHPIPEDPEDERGNNPDVSGAPMDDYVQDANTLDLPDNMDLGDDIEPGGEDLDEIDDTNANTEEPEGIMEDDQPDPPMDDATNNQRHPESIPEDINNGDQEMDIPDQTQEVEDGDNVEDEAMGEQAIAQPDVSAGDGTTSTEELRNKESGESTSTNQAGNSTGTSGKDSGPDKMKDNDGLPDISEHQPETQNADSEAKGAAAAGSQDGPASPKSDNQFPTNPLRSLGDALKEIRQRFDEILNGEQKDVPREQASDAGAPSRIEYLQPDDVDHDMQALGPSGEEQVAKLNELKLIDEDDPVRGTGPMDIDAASGPENYEEPSRDRSPETGPTSIEQRSNVEGAIFKSDMPADHDPSLNPSMVKADIDMADNIEQTIETRLRDWQSSGFPDSKAEGIWRLYESLTHDLAYALCEQLRLILEPTLATRLKGDYRTGKRLNMKKVISYIASDYTKDKIWLRRTRPSQREYQVLIAIDDSHSMAESRSVHLAFETLALVSKALSRLEAGDIAIAKFGETVDILHGFDEGLFTDQSGTKVISSFRFNQKATNVLSLVDTSLKVLENARERRSMNSSTATDLWQLEIIISDGMCQDHDRLRTVIRKAEEQRVMIVFIILDSLHPTSGYPLGSSAPQQGLAQGSILSMDKAEFKNVNGRMELQLHKYLDFFPFEYYVVLRNVDALPEVLAGTLKQFFERISEE